MTPPATMTSMKGWRIRYEAITNTAPTTNWIVRSKICWFENRTSLVADEFKSLITLLLTILDWYQWLGLIIP
jgi:hypothetical protein